MSDIRCPNVYCPFCGVILHSNDPDNLQHQWFAEIRAVFCDETRSCHPSLTGVGFIRYRNILFAPLDRNLSYRDTEALEELRLFQKLEGCCAYGFHDSCWKLFLARLSLTKRHCDGPGTLFNLLFNTPCPNLSYFQFGHNYGGAAAMHKPSGLPKRIDHASPFYADPYAIPSLETLESFAVNRPSTSRKRNAPESSLCLENSGGPDYTFLSLPTEIIQEILSYLSLAEVANIRLVCRRMGVLAACEDLPRSFWKSRFMLGQELDYIFPDLSVARDWSLLFHGTKSCLLSGEKSLENRLRIRGLLEPIATLVELDSTGERKPLGLPISSVASDVGRHWNFGNDRGEYLPAAFEGIRLFTGQPPPSGYGNQLTHGCRIQQYRIARFPSQTQGILCEENMRQIRISTVHIGARCYISGMRYSCPQVSLSPESLPLELGFCTPAREKYINFPPLARVKSIDVAFCESGLVGIKFIFTGYEESSSQWIGQHAGEGIAQGVLHLLESQPNHYFVVGLDVGSIPSFLPHISLLI
jgi:hypothetical protein